MQKHHFRRILEGILLIALLTGNFNVLGQTRTERSSSSGLDSSLVVPHVKGQLKSEVDSIARFAKPPSSVTIRDGKIENAPELPNKGFSVESPLPGRTSLPQPNLVRHPEFQQKHDSLGRRLSDLRDSIQSTTRQVDEFADPKQLVELRESLTEKLRDQSVILTEDFIKDILDSLRISRVDSILALARMTEELSTDEMMKYIGLPEVPAADFSSKADEVRDGIQNSRDMVEDRALQETSRRRASLQRSALEELAPPKGFELAGMDKKVLDSIRRAQMVFMRIRNKEREISEEIRSSVANTKKSFKDRSYFEALVSPFRIGEQNGFLFSPAFGFEVLQDLSVGVGPSLRFSREANETRTLVGIRSFLKYQLPYYRAYLQLEDQTENRVLNAEYFRGMAHSAFFGGGTIIPLYGSVGINFCVLYNISDINRTIEDRHSSWVIRLGISSLRGSNKSIRR